MSRTKGSLIINLQNAVAASENKSGETARPYLPIVARRKLADISNLQQKHMPFTEHQKSQSIPTTVKEYIEQLQKENMALAKVLAQRNKIVEQIGIELERLRLNFVKMREQNQHLALSHTQMLAELNSGKDKLKALQHELGCRNGLLQARSSKLEVNLIKEDKPSLEGRDHEKPRKAKRKLPSLSLGSPEQFQSEDSAGNRLPARRQSARFKAVKGDTVSKIDDAKSPKCSLSDGTAPSTSVDASVKNEDSVANRRQSARFEAVIQKQGDDLSEIDASTCVDRPSTRRQSARWTTTQQSHRFNAKQTKQADDLSDMDDTTSLKRSSVKNEDGSSCESQEVRKLYFGRPSRLAATKVHSYKEIPLNVKMRRENHFSIIFLFITKKEWKNIS